MNRITVHTQELNSYGFWVLTAGGDLSDFNLNPVMLYNHNRAFNSTKDAILPIGIVKDLKIELNGDITGVPEFDEDDDFAMRIKKKYDKKHLRAASIGLAALEVSEDPPMLKEGQLRKTVTKWKLKEISITDIPSNAKAVQLYDIDGNSIELSDTGEGDAIPLLTTLSQSTNPTPEMVELKPIAGMLKLSDNSSVADITLAITSLNDKINQLSAENQTLKTAQTNARKAEVDAEIALAVKDNRLTEDQTANWRKLFDVDHESTMATLKAMKPQVKLADTPKAGGATQKLTYEGKTFEELEKESPETLKQLRDTDIDTFNTLKAQSRYGSK